MAPKGSYTSSRMHGAAAKASEKAKAAFPTCDTLKCSYVGGDECVTKNSTVGFEWFVQVAGYSDKAMVKARCDHVHARGVPFPAPWRTSIKFSSLGETVEKSVKKLRDFNGISSSLRILGVPKHSPPPALGTTLVSGAVAQLQSRNGLRQDYLLAAQIDGDRRLGFRFD